MLPHSEIRREKDATFRLEFLNVFETGARQLLSEHPPTRTGREVARAHVVVVGLGRFGEAVVIEAARRQRAEARSGGECLRVTVIDRRARAKVEALRARRPEVAKACELSAWETEFESAEFHRGGPLADPGIRSGITSVYVFVDDESLALSAGLELHQHLRDLEVPIVVRMGEGTGLASMLSEGSRDQHAFSSLHAFPLLERTCQPRLLLDGTTELLARAIHETYLRKQSADGRTPAANPSMVAWEGLPEGLRVSNRDQAEHIPVKLRAVGCDLVPLMDPDATSFEFTAEEVEQLAALEHDRWMEERAREGWTPGAEKDLERKRSPYVVPWSELSEEVQEYDRVFIRELPRLVAGAGFQIHRSGGERRVVR